MANAVVDADGEIRTLDARALYRHAKAAAALATAAVRWELRDLGLGWWRREDGVWEVAGIDQRAIDEFSRRHNNIDEVKTVLEERLGRSLSRDEDDAVALVTRQAKRCVDADALRAEWRRRASNVGLDVTRCFGRSGEVIVYERLPRPLTERLFAELADPTQGLCASSTTFDRADVLAAVADWSIVDSRGPRRKVLLPPAEVERVADRFCASTLVAELGSASGGVIRRRDGSVVSDGQHEPRFATVELLNVEQEIVERFRKQQTGAAIVDGALVEAAIIADRGDGVILSDEQTQLVRAWCTSGHSVQAAVGRAGTGKTTTMRAAARAWRAAGFRVTGCAVKGEAARLLADEADIKADTVALLLARAACGQRVLDVRSVLIVDEASTIGSRDLLALLRLADAAGATVRLIGDTAQHGSVPAGGSFSHLVEVGGDSTPQLTHVRRLRDPGERRRAELVRAGRIEQALDELQQSGQLELTDSDAHTYAAMLTRWYEHRQASTPHPMVHGRNRQRRLLNQIAQSILAADGAVDLEDAITLRDGRRLAVGDEVIARHGDRRIHPDGNPAAWMRNGTSGRIVAIHRGDSPEQDRITMDTAGGLIVCQRSVFDRRQGGVDLRYAVTSYAVLGTTTDASTSAITAATARSELYVDITRGRDNNRLYATRTANADDAEVHLPAIQRELIPTLCQQLARGTSRPALALDPTALTGACRRHGLSLPALLAARRRGQTGGVERAIEQTIAAIRREARTNPPPTLTAVLPARPLSPHLAARWDDVAGDVAVHAAAMPPPRRQLRAHTAMEALLGPRPDEDAEHRKRWDEVADHVRAVAADIVIWQLHQARPGGGSSGHAPAWLRPYLTAIAETGSLATADLTLLQRLIDNVDAWRSCHRIPPDDPDVLGTVPDEPAEQAQFAKMRRRLKLRGASRGRSVT